MLRKAAVTIILIFLTATFGFAQAGLLRDYVGLLSIRYHPDVVEYMDKFRDSFEKKGYSDAAKAIDNYLKGLSGSGFIFVSEDGTSYVLTNEHVVAQSESLSITFEKQDGSKIIYDRLKVLFVDEEKDLALLVFDNGVNPFTQGLNFNAKPIDEGMDVFAAGFPGLGNTAIWQFSRGTISNVSARIPKDNIGDETIGPYIQHTAQIDPGNSGGPLLVETQGVPAGYAVLGINTLSAFRRQAANYAIPVDQVRVFIEAALSDEKVNDKDMVARKVDEFIKGLGANKAVYGHIAKFLSNGATATNAEFAISELLDKAPRTVLEDIGRTFAGDPVEGMNAAVAWQIENTMRSKSGTLKIDLDAINPNYKGGYDVTFNINDSMVKSEWIKEYGVFRLDTFGENVTGDKTLIVEKQKKKEQDKALRTDSNFTLSAGYAYVLGSGSAIHAALRLSSPFTYGFDIFYAFRDKYLNFAMNIGYAHAIRLDKFALTPFAELGFGLLSSEVSRNSSGMYGSGFGFALGINVKGGLMFTASAVPGLFGRAFYEHNFVFLDDRNKSIGNHGIIGISIGYAF